MERTAADRYECILPHSKLRKTSSVALTTFQSLCYCLYDIDIHLLGSHYFFWICCGPYGIGFVPSIRDPVSSSHARVTVSLFLLSFPYRRAFPVKRSVYGKFSCIQTSISWEDRTQCSHITRGCPYQSKSSDIACNRRKAFDSRNWIGVSSNSLCTPRRVFSK